MFTHRIQQYIDDKKLFTLKEKVLVAFSGGPDSVALLRCLLSLGYRCECAHCNFHLRGAESDRDEQFVRSLCHSLQVPLHVIHFDTQAYSAQQHVSIEMAARELRYSWFEKLRQEVGAQVIAVAHHRDDSVETFLLNLIRGTGIQGLKGIAPVNGAIVRPMLQVGREEILSYLESLGQEAVTDSTNLEDEYTRNKIRLHLLPFLQTMNPSIAGSLAETADRLREVAMVYERDRAATLEKLVQRGDDSSFSVPMEGVLNDVSPMSLLHELLYPLGFNASQLKDIYRSLHHQSGRVFRSDEWEVLRDRTSLYVQRISETAQPQLETTIYDKTPDFHWPTDSSVACLDADRVSLPLTVRRWQPGDKFVPLGMKGRKRVSDYLTNRKFSLFQKERLFVACSGEEIVWLIGERMDHRFRVTDQTERILEVRLSTHSN